MYIQPCWIEPGGALRILRFMPVPTSPSSAGPNTAQNAMSSKNTDATQASLSRQSIASALARAPRGSGIGAAGLSARAISVMPDARVEHGVGDVDQDIEDEDGRRGHDDRSLSRSRAG